MPYKDKEKQRSYNRMHMQKKRLKYVEPVEPVEPSINITTWKSQLTLVHNQILEIYPIYAMKKAWSSNIALALIEIKRRRQVKVTLLDGRIIYFNKR